MRRHGSRWFLAGGVIACVLPLLAGAADPLSLEGAGGGEPPGPRRPDVFRVWGGAGYMTVRDEWKTSFDEAIVPGLVGSALVRGESKLEYKGRDGVPWELGAAWRPLSLPSGALELRVKYTGFDLSGGTDQDSDTAFVRTGGATASETFSVSESDLKSQGSMWSVECGWILPPARGLAGMRIAPFAGYAQWHDALETANLRQIVSPVGEEPASLPGVKDSSYELTWELLEGGVDVTVPLARALDFTARAAMLVCVDYHADAVWYLRPDLAQNPSFDHESRGGLGADLSAGLAGSLFAGRSWQVGWEAGAFYQQVESRQGADTTYFADGDIARTGLDYVRRSSTGVHGRLVLGF